MTALVTVDFRGDTLFAVERDEGAFVAIKPICDRLGLSWGSQYNRIMRDPLLREGVFVSKMPSPGGIQETVCLALRLINGWLFGISVRHVKPELREDVLAYQRECYETLADRFLGRRAGAEPQAAISAAPEGLEDRSLREREHNLDLVARMQAMKGPEWAFALYKRLGLPVVEPEPVPPTAAKVAADRAFAADAFAVALDAFARAHAPWTGTPRALRAALNAEASSAARAARTWPGTDQALGNALKRLTPDLRARGILVGRRHSGERFVTLALAEE
ncbi:phage antirepressor N-terminal domain-containing protein [Methylobacterium sp. MA0201]|uniref:phage antirepressor N-terminal domain-containing protein n=1 Tax=Methylobacterium alsaeris TaxID=3344826 RepID=UPI003756CF9F